MNNNFSDVEQRVRRYWYIDGIGELIAGGMFLILGLYFSAGQYFGDAIGGILQAGFAVFLIGAVFYARRLINSLKARYTYPRTGYVEYQTNEKHQMWRRALALGIAMAVAILFVALSRRIDTIDMPVALTGIVVAAILFVKQKWFSGIVRIYILGVASLILGILLSFSGLPEGYNLGTFYGLMGLALLISGGLTLQRYLRENPVPEDAEHQNG